MDSARPCPWASCKYHMYIHHEGDVEDVDELPETCALDIADRGGVTLAEVGTAFGLTRERIRQIEKAAMFRLVRHRRKELRTILGDDLPGAEWKTGRSFVLRIVRG